MLLNYSDRENANIPWHQQKSLGSVFKAAGYQTFWLDNQENLYTNAFYNAFNAFVYGFDYRFCTDENWTSVLAHHDLWLLSLFRQNVREKMSAKNFFLFHLFGSHGGYKNRFPKSYAKFTPKDIDDKNLKVKNDKDKQIVADYVNSIHYTDHVLGEIFKLFQGKDTIIFYLSDHAQDIFQSGNTYGHKCSAYGVEIPFMVFVTDTFKQRHPDKVKLIEQALHKPLMSDDLIHSLLPLEGF
ncbi:hypothetical protein NHP190003_08610 [Helicobacter sp. NHP19-003]|uniref:Sulfatase N-terminal domain-containing protein n=1 Tax=Helicobacter gastrocanis TaxID=2849641 RepID=A0ABM7SD06_9HELI|nr:hypothetical protein NHP190003_08610 [Helicobacter sp. NHP19-003]